ncbi:MarR family winged helix-turn-helix transcriptional regulator [Streptomyces sp. NBC_01216]|uniref:MarR family winged helix-turn-helix transcriptional regulator n=1 Tax=Streptomyces sp. NBC_01216 TaxID=2903778 RepID=UPI002E0D719C|nr:MarR family winged helix-turn-helix transcriptional regulator [Streptomyces sp. NBC_01216]
MSHQNLRDSLGYAQDFSFDFEPEFFSDSTSDQIDDAARKWLAELAMKYERDIHLQPRMWRLLEDLAGIGGTCSPGDHQTLGFNDRTHMRKNVVDLERFKLVTSSRDETDQRRRSIEMTSKGWLVYYSRSQGLINPTLPGFST